MYSYASLIRDIAHFVRPYRWRFFCASLLRFSSDTVYLYTTYALSSLIAGLGYYAAGKPTNAIWFFFVTWAASQMYVPSARQGAKYLCYVVAERAKLDSQMQTLRHLYSFRYRVARKREYRQ